VNGSCSCHNYYFGPNCDQLCIDTACNIPCTCDNKSSCSGNKSVCNNDISIINQNSSLTLTVFLQGNTKIELSNININTITIQLQDLSISDSTMIFYNSSSIVSTGCINITNTILKVDLSHPPKNGKLVLFNSSSGCLHGTYNITYFNTPPCYSFSSKQNDYSLYVLILPYTCSSGIPAWEIAVIIVGIVVGLGIIFIILALTVPSIKYAIFPAQKVRYSLKHKMDDV